MSWTGHGFDTAGKKVIAISKDFLIVASQKKAALL